MKKNLFLLFSFYFFVIQAIFLGLLRWEFNFYWLALINFVFLIVIFIVSKEKKWKKIKIQNEYNFWENHMAKVDGDKYIQLEEIDSLYYEKRIKELEKPLVIKREQKEKIKKLKEQKKEAKRKELEKKVALKKEQKEHKRNMKKMRKKKVYKPIYHFWFFIISILFGFFVRFWLWEIVLYLHLLISIAASFMLFVIFGLLFKYKWFIVWESKLYMISLIGLLIWSAIIFFNVNFDFLSFETYDNQSDDNRDNDQIDISTWLENMFVAVDVDWDIENLTWKNLSIDTGDTIDLRTKATFDDVIKFILKKNNVVLNETKNIKFTYVPYSSEDYAYYRTAYDKRLIWKSTKPNNNLLCETYVVMNWLVEGRSVSSYGDIKTLYWNYASKNDKLPTCDYGDYVVLWDLIS